MCKRYTFFQQEFVKIVNNFIQKDTFIVWDKLPATRRRIHLTKLMHAAEQATLSISKNFQKTTQFDTNSSDVGKKSRSISKQQYFLNTLFSKGKESI